MAQLIKEARRFQQLAGILKEEDNKKIDPEVVINPDGSIDPEAMIDQYKKIIAANPTIGDKIEQITTKISSDPSLTKALEQAFYKLTNTKINLDKNITEAEVLAENDTKLNSPSAVETFLDKSLDYLTTFSRSKAADTATTPVGIASTIAGGAIGRLIAPLMDTFGNLPPILLGAAGALTLFIYAREVYLDNNPGINDDNFNPYNPFYDPNDVKGSEEKYDAYATSKGMKAPTKMQRRIQKPDGSEKVVKFNRWDLGPVRGPKQNG